MYLYSLFSNCWRHN